MQMETPRTRTVTPAALQSKTFCSCLDLVYHIYSIISAAGRWMEEQMLRQVGTHEGTIKLMEVDAMVHAIGLLP